MHCELLYGFIEGPGGKTLENFTIFSFKLVGYSLAKMIKLKLFVSNTNSFWFFLGQK